MSPTVYVFNGPEYSHEQDTNRLTKQHERVKAAMEDGKWRTLGEIAQATGDPEASVSAQLRHLRKPRFGAYIVHRRKRGDIPGLYEYRVEPPPMDGSQTEFPF